MASCIEVMQIRMQYVLQWVLGGPLSCALLAPCAGCGSGSTIAVPYSVGAVLFSVCTYVCVCVCTCVSVCVYACVYMCYSALSVWLVGGTL